MSEVILDTLIDSIKLVPFLFLTYLAMEDMADTLEVIQTIRQGINPKLAVGGILLTMRSLTFRPSTISFSCTSTFLMMERRL